jgi:regulator of protease activity HflC (stomatin/prohibitin superfamily)
MADQRWQAKLVGILSDCLDEGQARVVCFDLGIDYDSLCKDPATGQPQARSKAETLQALIEFCQRHRIMSQFLSTLRSECRDVADKLPDIPVADSEKRAKVEFHIESDIISFGNQGRAKLVQAIAELFDIEQDSLHVLTEAAVGRGAEVHLLLGMSEKDAERLARPVEIDSRFDKLHNEYHVRLIRLHEDKLRRWERLSWKWQRALGCLRALLYLGGFCVLWFCGTQFARPLLPDPNEWKAYLFRLPNAETTRFYLVAVLAALPGWAAWIGLLAILTKFMQMLYTIGDWRQTFDYFFLCVFGPLFFRYPSVIVQEGQVKKEPRAMPQSDPDGPGGPCQITIFNDSAIVTERAGRRIAVVGPGGYEAGRFEKIYQTLDLRPQTRSSTAACITRDGVPIKAKVGATYRIRWKGEPSAESPYPADPDALLQAAAGHVVASSEQGKQVRTWADQVGGSPEGALRAIVARYRLDELIEPRDPGLRPRSELMRHLTEALRKSAVNLGAEIVEVHLDAFEFDPELQGIKQQWMDTWRVPWEGQVQARKAQADAGAIRMKEMAQAYAQLELISAFTQEFKATDDESTSIGMMVSRFVEVISRMAANPDASIFLPREALQTLEEARKMLAEAKVARPSLTGRQPSELGTGDMTSNDQKQSPYVING